LKAGNFFKRRVGKTYHFLDENIPCLEGRRGGGGVARALTRKIGPR